MSGRRNLVHDLLDVALHDVEDRPVGRVDDVELTGDPPRVTALLVGTGFYPRRLPGIVGRLARRLVGPETWGRNVVRVPWADVDVEALEPGRIVHLRRKGEDMGLGEGDDPERWVVSRLPWS